MKILNSKKDIEKPEEIYEDVFRHQLYSQGKLCEKFVTEHIKNEKIYFKEIRIRIDKIKRIYFISSGDCLPLALLSEINFEAIVDLPCKAISLNEINASLIDKHTLVIFLAETGEDIEDIQVQMAKAGASIIRILDSSAPSTNTINLSITDKPPIPILSFSLRYIALCLLAIYLGRKNKMLTELYYKVAVRELLNIKDSINAVIKNEQYIMSKAHLIDKKGLLICGRGVDFAASKYVSNILSTVFDENIFAVHAGDLPLLKKRNNIIALASSNPLLSLLGDECFSLKVIPFCCDESCNNIFYDGTLPLLNPLFSCIVFQIIAYNSENNDL